MIVLDATTKSLEVLLAGSVTTNQLPIVAAYVDVTTTTYTAGESDTVTNNTTAVTAVAAPGASTQRQIKLLTIRNRDTAAATVTVRYNNNSTTREILKITLSVDDTLVYTDGEGFRVLNSTGSVKQVSGASINLDDLGDVVITSAAAGQIITLSGGLWVNAFGGKLVQVARNQTATGATGTTVIPYDNTVPQNTEGDQYITQAITPKYSGSTLLIIALLHVSNSAVNEITMALFQDTTAGALASAIKSITATNEVAPLLLIYSMTAGTTSSTTFKIRMGNAGSGGAAINGTNGGQKDGGVLYSSLTIIEIAA